MSDLLLDRLRVVASDLGASEIERDAETLDQRIRDRLLFVAVLGQFKRGKSTLINALIGRSILPAGVPPVTSVVTVVRSGSDASARLRFDTEGWRAVEVQDLDQYVSESGNPENKKGVRAIEVRLPSPILEQGLCLVDTPGLGSVLAGNTAETRAFLPHVDAAVLVTGTDPPISGDELQLVIDLDPSVRDVLVVLSKVDRYTSEEIAEAVAFTRRTLAARAPGRTFEIFAVSAKMALAGEHQPEWQRLIDALERLARESGASLLSRSRQRETSAISSRLQRYLGEQRRALALPVEELQRSLETLESCIEEAERFVSRLRHVFDADQQRLARRLEDERLHFTRQIRPTVQQRLVSALDEENGGERAIAMAQHVVEAAVRAWRDELRPVVEQEFADVVRRFASQLDALISTLRTTTAVAASLPERFEIPTELHARSGFYFSPMMTAAATSLPSRIAGSFRSAEHKRRAAETAVFEFLDRVLAANTSHVVSDYIDRVVESRRSIEAGIRRSLQEIAAAASRGYQRARSLHEAGAGAVRAEIERLDSIQRELDRLITDTKGQ